MGCKAGLPAVLIHWAASSETREIILIVIHIQRNAQSQLFHVVQACDGACFLAGAVQCRKQHTRQNCNNCNNDEKLYQGKTIYTCSFHRGPPFFDFCLPDVSPVFWLWAAIMAIMSSSA